MANVDRPNGFRPYKTLAGHPWNGSFVKMYSSDDLFMGDRVKAAAAGTGGYQDCDRETGTTSGKTLGVVVGWEADPTNLENLYHVGSATEFAVHICVEPEMVYICQGDGAGTVATEAEVGRNFDVVSTGGDPATGLSNQEVDEDSQSANLATPLHCVGLSTDPSNQQGVANQEFLVLMNMNFYRNDAVGSITGV